MKQLAAVLAIGIAGTASAGPLGVQVVTRSTQTAVHRGESAIVEVLVTDTSSATSTTQTFRVMSCSWTDAWRSDDPGFGVDGVDCAKNTEITLTLAPGATDLRQLRLFAAPDAALGPHSVRLGWTPIGAKATEWGAPLAFEVVEVSAAATITAKRIADRRYTFAIANATAHPLQLGGMYTVQHEVDGAWADLSPMDASCEMSPPACTTLAPGAPVVTREWQATTCARCACSANTPAEPGNYRLVAHSCDGKRDYVGGAISLLR